MSPSAQAATLAARLTSSTGRNPWARAAPRTVRPLPAAWETTKGQLSSPAHHSERVRAPIEPACNCANVSRSARLPIMDWVVGYRKDWFRLDLVAGLTAAAVVIPKALAYATIAGLPVQVGLYTALLPMVIYALLGTSRPLSVSTTTTLAILVAAELATVAPNGDPAALATATATLALLVGAI